MLVVFTNIDVITGPCNNIRINDDGNLETLCNQCFLGNIALLRTDFSQQVEKIKKIRENYPDASYFFYPAEISSSKPMIPLMLGTGQKTMSNGKVSGIAEILADRGFQSVSFSLYSDWKEMNVFYGYTEQEFNTVIDNIQTATKRGLDVEVFSIVTPLNFQKLPELYELSKEIGVSNITLLPLEPLGKAKDMGDEYFLDQNSFEQVMGVVEGIKSPNKPYVSMGLGFGPSKSSIQRFFSNENKDSWVKTKTLCPVIDSEYAVVAGKDVYFCFKTVDEPFGKIGYVNDKGKIIIDRKYDLSPQTIMDNIDGICLDCEILSECLGGCRSKAISDALRENPEAKFQDIMYKGQKFCRYNSQKKGDSI